MSVVIFIEEPVHLVSQEDKVNGFGQHGIGVKGQGLGEQFFFRFSGQQDAGQEVVVLAEDFQRLHTGNIFEDHIEDGQVDLVVGYQLDHVMGRIGDEGVETARLEDFRDGLRPGPVSVADKYINAIRLCHFIRHAIISSKVMVEDYPMIEFRKFCAKNNAVLYKGLPVLVNFV
jgi:hypothetical protein